MERLKMEYTSAFEHKGLLNVLTDYLPRYMILRSKCQTERPVAENTSSIGVDRKELTVFFEELSDVLPLLEKHCRNALDSIKNI